MGTFVDQNAAMTALHRSDLYFDGVDHFEAAGGGNIRVVCYVLRIIEGKQTRVILDETFLMPAASFPDAIGKALMALARQVVVSPSGTLTILH
jgi:hypothetical protein